MSKRVLALTGAPTNGKVSERPKRKSRWSTNNSEKTFIPGMPTQLPPNMTQQQEKMYILQLQIEDASRKLKTGDLGIPKNPEDRSPSPEPIYSTDGKRLNTREYRTRKKLEDERHNLIQQLTELNPEYKPPMDYRAPQNRIIDKVFIPQEEHPEINFVGLLIGPRGNTLKALEKETGAKIIIRGKGSVKEGKLGRRDGMPLPGEDEPLHAYIQSPSAECVDKAVKKISSIIHQGIEVPESQNDLRKQQLRELALLNGTLRTHEGLLKLRAMAEAQSIATNTIQCTVCGGFGHLSSDCKGPGQMDGYLTNPNERAKMDSEYTALMAELGVSGSQFLQSGPGSFKAQTKAPRQPPPPGVAPSEDDDDVGPITSTNGSISNNVSGPLVPVTSNDYAFTLPPPPPPPVHYPPSGVAPWPGSQAGGYPYGGYPAPGYPSYPEAGFQNGSGPPPGQWQVPGAPAWGGGVSGGPPGYYMQPGSNDYWSGYGAGGGFMPHGMVNPPPPPPPGV